MALTHPFANINVIIWTLKIQVCKKSVNVVLRLISGFAAMAVDIARALNAGFEFD